MVNEAAFELVVNNMRETPVNNKKVFARYKLGIPQESFQQKLMELWENAADDDQERLSIAYPQIASCILEYYTLPEKKREKYLHKLVGV